MSNKILRFIDSTLIDLGRQFKWTYLPPLMIYLAAGISGLTGIVGTFFVKDYLNSVSYTHLTLPTIDPV